MEQQGKSPAIELTGLRKWQEAIARYMALKAVQWLFRVHQISPVPNEVFVMPAVRNGVAISPQSAHRKRTDNKPALVLLY